MKNSKKTNHAAYLSLCKEVESLELRTMFLDTVLAELFDEESDSFDLDAAGAVLSELENVVFQLRVAMFTAQNSDLPDGAGGLMDSITGLALDVCDMRDALMDVLDDILADADDAFAEAAAEAEVVDCFFVRVPADAEIEIDGEPYDFSDCVDKDGVIEVPVEPGEALTVDGEDIDLEDCEPGEVYSILDGEEIHCQ